MTAPKKDVANQTQLSKFMEAARELETDDREQGFDAVVAKVAKSRLKRVNANPDSQRKNRAGAKP